MAERSMMERLGAAWRVTRQSYHETAAPATAGIGFGPVAGAAVIRQYHGSQSAIQSAYRREAADFLARGYRVESQQVIPGRRGCAGVFLGFVLLGLPFLFVRPKDTLIVTYRAS